jgi:TonB-linked SusC/RagA family outer membrane protein
VITSKFDRISARFNYVSSVTDWLELGARTSITTSKQNYPDQAGSNYENVIQYIRSMSSIYPVHMRGENGELLLDAAGNPMWDFGKPDPNRTVNVNRVTLQPSNLVATTLVNEESRRRLLNNLNVHGEVKFTPNLRFRTNFGIDRYHFTSMSYETPEFGNGENVGGRLNRQQDLTTSWTWNNMLNYNRRFGIHNIDVMGSVEAYKYDFNTMNGQKTGFPFGGLTQFNSAATTESLTGSSTSTTINSYLGRVKYDLKGKYFIEGTVRWDASSRFAPEERWGFFPAVGVSWVISDEEFVKNVAFINMLKFRASYGELGNEGLTSRFPYLSTFSTGYDELTNPGIYLDQLGNEGLKWEKQANFNVGVDFALLKNRLNGSIDYFDKTSIDLLFQKPLVFSGGIPSVDFNIGEIYNRGVELSLTGVPIRGKNFNWEISTNLTRLTNRITKLTESDTLAPAGAYRFVVGKSRYEFYLPEWAGVDPATGDPLWYKDEVDANGVPTGKKITVNQYEDATRHWVGSGVPKLTGGLSQRFNYRGFDLSVLFNFSFGNKYYDVNYAGLMHGFTAGYGTQMHVDMLNRWRAPGDVTDVPRLDENNTDINQFSTRYLFNGDYVRLRNITLGYSFNPDRSKKIIKNARFYLQADNYATWSNLKKGADPEANITGSAATTSSVFKTASAGVEITF